MFYMDPTLIPVLSLVACTMGLVVLLFWILKPYARH